MLLSSASQVASDVQKVARLTHQVVGKHGRDLRDLEQAAAAQNSVSGNPVVNLIRGCNRRSQPKEWAGGYGCALYRLS